MKNRLLTLALISATPFSLFAQSTPTAASSDTYQMGARKVRIPAPEGFIDITTKYAHVAGRMKATEDPANDFLAVHVPETFIPKLQISEDIDLGFYTKVSVPRQVRAIDLGPDFYAVVVSGLEKNFGSYIEPEGPVMKNVEKNSVKGLTELLGNDTTLSINATRNLGFIEKSDKVFSGMMLVSFEVHGRKVTTLGTFSVLHIDQRVFVVSAYRMSPDENSIRELTDFTKKWTARIVAANK